MQVPQRQLRKNHIGILHDEIDGQRAIESLAKSDHAMKDYFLRLMAALPNRHRDGR